MSSMAALPAASMEVHENLWHATEDISEILSWAQWISVWLFTVGILGVFSIYSHIAYIILVIDLILGGFLAIISAAFNFAKARKSQKILEDWDSEMLPFLYSVKFELLPSEKGESERDIWNRYKSVFRDLQNAEPKTRLDRWLQSDSGTLGMFATSQLKFNGEVKGRRGPHKFHIYARTPVGRLLFVKRFTHSEPVSRSELEQLKGDVEDVLKRVGSEYLIVGAFASGGFAQEAVEYSSSEEARIEEETPMDLIQELPSGFRVISVLPD